MTRDEFEDRQYHISVTAGMNQRYHQSRAHHWRWWDRTFRIAVGLLAVAGAYLAVVGLLLESFGWDIFAVIVASVAAFAAIVLNVLPVNDWAMEHQALFRQWTDLREDIDALLFELDGEPTPELIGRLRQLDGKVHRICGSEPGCKSDLLDKCYREEIKSRPQESCAV